MRRSPRAVVGFALLLSAAAAPARAHAPLARAVAVDPGAAGIALRMPGFGLLVNTGSAAEPSFAYACDALLGLQAHEANAPFAYRADGALLVATERGLRIARGDGCPSAAQTGELAQVSIAALAVHGRDSNLVFAISAGSAPSLYRSRDGGEHWELRSRFEGTGTASALVLDPEDPDAVYVSLGVAGSTALSIVASSGDGGASFVRSEQERALTLLHVASGAARLWAMARTGGVRGVDILRAERPEGPWQAQLQVNFFGGFAAEDGTDVIWVGDEAGSVFRSSDGGDSFEDVASRSAVACLAHARGALWACTPGSTRQSALAVWGEQDAFEAVVSFAEVGRLVECGDDTDVPSVCAAAWNEWRADAQGPAGVAGAAGAAGMSGGAGASEGTAGAAGMSQEQPTDVEPPGACSVRAGHSATRLPAYGWLALLTLGVRRRRRSAHCASALAIHGTSAGR